MYKRQESEPVPEQPKNPTEQPEPEEPAEQLPSPEAPVEPETPSAPEPAPDPETFTVTLSVRCDTILQNRDKLKPEKLALLPEDGVLFASREVVANRGESVFHPVSYTHLDVYKRQEYPIAVSRLKIAIEQAKEYGLLGEHIMGTDFSFDLEIRLGAGAFVCGEETALMTSIEGHRGEPRPRPPFPANKGLFAKPTILNNVETYANVAQIILCLLYTSRCV